MTDDLHKRADAYLIVKRDVYYKPNAQGYTGVKDHAGRYTLAEVAERFPNKESSNQDGMSFIHEDDAPEYSKGCYWDVRLEHQRDKALAENAALLARLEDVTQERDLLEKTHQRTYEAGVSHWTARAEKAEAALAAAYRMGLEAGAKVADGVMIDHMNVALTGLPEQARLREGMANTAEKIRIAIRALAAQEGER